MPLIAIDVPTPAYCSIRELLSQGLYESIEQFVEVALFNQLALERRAERESARVLELSVPDVQHGARNGQGEQSAPRRSPVVSDGAQKSRRSLMVKGHSGAKILNSLRASETDPPALEACAAQSRPADERIYGLVNRLFPLKLVLRWVDLHSAREGRWLSLEEVCDPLGDDAGAVGSLLSQADVMAKRTRDDLLSTGLPRRNNPASRDRFISQFVARSTRAGHVYPGALFQYSLAVIRNGRITLTDPGRHLAGLDNPILDGEMGNATQSLSDAERQVLVEQIRRYVPAEARDAKLALETVRNGANTPESVSEVLRGHFPDSSSTSFVRNHVSGVISRIADLGLLNRRWEGRRVTYKITESGLHVLNWEAASFAATNGQDNRHLATGESKRPA